MAAYIIGMQKIVSLASQRKRVAAPRAEPDGASVGYLPISRRLVEKTPGSKDFLSSSRMTGKREVIPINSTAPLLPLADNPLVARMPKDGGVQLRLACRQRDKGRQSGHRGQ